jgi:hypothetical protein
MRAVAAVKLALWRIGCLLSRWLNKRCFLHQQEATFYRPHHLLPQPRIPSPFGLTTYLAVCPGRSLSLSLPVLARPVVSSAQR